MSQRVPPSLFAPLLQARHALCCALATAWLAGCGGGGGDDPLVCTAEVRASVVLTAIDPAGTPLTDVSAAYQVDGGPVQTVVCAAMQPCPIGSEVRGVFLVTATKAGYTAASGTVTVLRDACHVQTQPLTLTLRPVP